MPQRKAKRPAGTNWPAVHRAYVNGNDSAATIAKRFRTTASAVSKRITKGGWTAERARIAEKVQARAQASLETTKADELAEFNKTDVQIARAFRAMVAQRIRATQGDHAAAISPADLRSLASAWEIAQRAGRLALGLTTGNTALTGDPRKPISIVDVTKLTTEQITALLAAQSAALDDPAAPGGTEPEEDG